MRSTLSCTSSPSTRPTGRRPPTGCPSLLGINFNNNSECCHDFCILFVHSSMAHEPQCETFSLTMPQRMPRMSIPVNISTHETLGVKLKKTKEEADSAKRKLTEMLQRVHKLENTATRHEKLSVLAKNNCMRLYEVKKYKIFNQTILEENRQRREMFQ